jgi:hypothetical protein
MRSLSAFWTGLLLVLLIPAMRAQVACPIPSPGLQWSNQTVMGLGISSFSGLVEITGALEVEAGSWPVGVYWVVAGTFEGGRAVLPITIQR